MRKTIFCMVWIILTGIGVLLMIPYSLLEIITEGIEDILEKIEYNILNDKEKKKKNEINANF